ncbi:MAG: TetR/AcrR family transcriptional regulator [Mycobacterium sp.]
MGTQHRSGRAAAWGADLPVDEADARERLLAAAGACYGERGVRRTRVSDIANKAGVHRRTVYDYFPTKDALLAACFVRAITGVLDAAEHCWQTDEPFLDQIVNAMIVGLEAARNSPTMALLIGADELGETFRAAEASELWRKELAETLGRRLAAAAASGEVRDDVSAETLAHWCTRIAFSLVAEPGRTEDGGDEGLIRTFLPASLAPRPGR